MSSFLDYEGLKHFTTYIINRINSSAGALGVRSFKGRMGNVEPQSGDYTADMVGAVPTSRTINGKPLTDDITIEVEVPENDGVTSFNSRKGDVVPKSGDYTASMVGAVPTYRTVNGKALSSNITIGLDEIAAASRRVEFTSYIGTNTFGDEQPNSLTFSFTPYIVIWFIIDRIDRSQSMYYLNTSFLPTYEVFWRYGYCLTTRLNTTYQSDLGPNGCMAKLDSSRKTLYWYTGQTGNTNDTSNSRLRQLNSSTYNYYVVAFG